MSAAKKLLAVVALGLGLAACGGEGPKQVYYGMATAAEMGDLDTFLEGFTDDSKKLIEAQLSLSDAYGLKNENPLSLLVFSTVEEVEMKDDDKAILTVSRGNSKRRILMVNVPDVGWRIDARELAEFWDQEKKGGNR